jgi:hypothetical protein
MSKKIERMYVWLALDPQTHEEGVIASKVKGEWMPLITMRKDLAHSLEKHAKQVSEAQDAREYYLAEFIRTEQKGSMQ